MLLTFGGTSITLPAPIRPTRRDDLPVQDVGRDSSGNLYLVRRGGKRQVTHSLQLKLSAAQYDALDVFLIGTVQGQRNAFTWTDEQGAAHVCRMVGPELSGQPLGGGRMAVQLELVEWV